jgi:hypothetical protein
MPVSNLNISLESCRPKNGPEQYHILCALYQQHPRFRDAAGEFLSPADKRSLLSSKYKASEYRRYCVKLLKNVIIQRGKGGCSYKNCGTGHHLALISDFQPANRTKVTVFRCVIDPEKGDMVVHEENDQILLRQTCRYHKEREVELRKLKQKQQIEKRPNPEVVPFEEIASTLESNKDFLANSCDGVYSTGHVSQYTDENFHEILDNLFEEFDAGQEETQCEKNISDLEWEESRSVSSLSARSFSSLLSSVSDISLKGLQDVSGASFTTFLQCLDCNNCDSFVSNVSSLISPGIHNPSKLRSFRSCSDFASNAAFSAFSPSSHMLHKNESFQSLLRSKSSIKPEGEMFQSSFRSKSPIKSEGENARMKRFRFWGNDARMEIE